MQNLGSFEGILELPQMQNSLNAFLCYFSLPKMVFCLITHKISALDHVNVFTVTIDVCIPNILANIPCLYHAQFSRYDIVILMAEKEAVIITDESIERSQFIWLLFLNFLKWI